MWLWFMGGPHWSQIGDYHCDQIDDYHWLNCSWIINEFEKCLSTIFIISKVSLKVSLILLYNYFMVSMFGWPDLHVFKKKSF